MFYLVNIFTVFSPNNITYFNGIHSYLCKKPSELEALFNKHIDDYKIEEECPYGDGHSAEKIVEILEKEFYE